MPCSRRSLKISFVSAVRGVITGSTRGAGFSSGTSSGLAVGAGDDCPTPVAAGEIFAAGACQTTFAIKAVITSAAINPPVFAVKLHTVAFADIDQPAAAAAVAAPDAAFAANAADAFGAGNAASARVSAEVGIVTPPALSNARSFSSALSRRSRSVDSGSSSTSLTRLRGKSSIK